MNHLINPTQKESKQLFRIINDILRNKRII